MIQFVKRSPHVVLVLTEQQADEIAMALDEALESNERELAMLGDEPPPTAITARRLHKTDASRLVQVRAHLYELRHAIK